MSPMNLLRQLIPPPRTALSWSRALPLILFLVCYAGLCLSLEWSQQLLFANRWAFLLMLVAPWIWWMHIAGGASLGPIRGTMVLLVRLSLVGLFAMLLAEPRAVRTRDVLSVVYAVDVSSSVGEESVDSALRFVTKTVAEKPEQDEAGLVVFGRNAAVELPPRITFPLEALNSRIDRDATDLSTSLSLAAAMLPEENRGRIVLISDGMETQGALNPVLDDLRSRDVEIDVLPIQYQYDEEVWIERLDLPHFVRVGETYEGMVVLSSLKPGSGTLTLSENGIEVYRQQVDFQAGKNRFNIPIYLRDAGYYEYEASIQTEAGSDHLKDNNSVVNYIFIEGQGKVLLVTDPQGDPRDWQSLAETIRESERAVEVRDAYDMPRESLSLMSYDCIIMVNVAADAFDVVQLRAIRDAVYDQGAGLFMVGGQNSFGPGGYHRTVIEEALPVSMDITQKKVLPKGALAIILHTCEFPEGNTWGKRITKQAIKVLGAQDEVGVLVYGNTGEQWLFELTPAADYEQLATRVNGALIGDMPSFATTMELGLTGLKKSDAATKHMIIISDGDPGAPPPDLIAAFIENKISVSMVAIFPHGGQDISKMRSVAGATGGRYYFPADPRELPSIFIKEAKTLKRSMIQNRTISPEVGYPSSVVKGVVPAPPLHGYVLTTAKPRAQVVLQATVESDGGEQVDPVLATWRFGLGNAAAFTSDLSPNWGKDWMAWEQRRPLLQQLVTQISRVRREGHLKMYNYLSGSDGVIVVEDYHPDASFLEMQARVTGPRERTETVQLKQVGPRRYQATVPLWGKGRYQVVAVGKAGERTDQAVGGLILPYSPEYLRFRSNPIVLDRIADKTQGQQLESVSTADEIYGRRKPKRSSRQVFDWFLIGLAVLVPMDVGLRRIQLDWALLTGWLGLGRRQADSGATMETLLRHKRGVTERPHGERTKQPVTQKQSGIRKTPKPMRKTPRSSSLDADDPADRPQPAQQDAASTTEKLLQMKRKQDRS